LEHFQHQLKGVSFLPSSDDGVVYQQMPYEEVTKDDYTSRVAVIKPIHFERVEKGTSPIPTKFCDNDFCEIDPAEASLGQEKLS